VIDGFGLSTPCPSRFISGKENWYPFYRRLGRPLIRPGQVRKISPAAGFDTQTIQSVASCYTDYTELTGVVAFVSKT
jgi:hypothetical protein